MKNDREGVEHEGIGEVEQKGIEEPEEDVISNDGRGGMEDGNRKKYG